MKLLENRKSKPHTGQNSCHQKSLQITNVGEDVENGKLSYTVGGNVKLLKIFTTENSMGVP